MKPKFISCSKLFTLLALQCLPFLIKSQVTFQQVYPTTYDKTARDILPTSDGGYILAGYTNTTNPTDCDLYVMKTDGMGNKLWENQYGGARPDYAYNMLETTDGNYFIVGYTASLGPGDLDGYLLKIDPSGNKLMEKKLGGSGNDEAREIVKTNDNNYVITGTFNMGTSSESAFIMKIDLAGNILWTKTHGSMYRESSNSIKQCQDGGFIMTGKSETSGNGLGRARLVRTNSTGDTLWTQRYGSSLDDEGVCVIENSDGSFVFVERDSTAANDIDVHVIKTNSTGSLVWEKTYGGNVKDTPKSICATADGGFLVGAISRSFGWVNPDMWILKLDGAGDLSWSNHFGSSDHEHCYKAKEWDNGYIAVGHSRSYGPNQKVMFVKMNGAGVVGINEYVGASQFNIYPNPSADGLINIVSENNSPINFTLSNALGQVIYAGNAASGTSDKRVDLSKQERGIYLLTLESDKGISTRKVIIGK